MAVGSYYINLIKEVQKYVPPEQLATISEAKAFLGIS